MTTIQRLLLANDNQLTFRYAFTKRFLCYLLLAVSYAAVCQQPKLQHGIVYSTVENIQDYYVSEKLDGIRGYWDSQYLFTRNGHKINAPSWFTANWPTIALDGELWIARGAFERVSSIIRTQQPNEGLWQQVKFMLFDLNANEHPFQQRVQLMKNLVDQTRSPYLQVIEQKTVTTETQLFHWLDTVVEQGGEGLMLHHKNARYITTQRNSDLMKLKKYQDAEATVIAHMPGKGKYTGMLGAIAVKTPQGIIFNIGSGFSDQQRQNPPKVGTLITYKYFGLTKYGKPRFASFVRERLSE